MYTWYREKYIIFTNSKSVTIICAQHFTRENAVLQERQFWLGRLYGSCSNASLSCYTLYIYFVFKKLILKK